MRCFNNTTEIEETIKNIDILVLAVPSVFTRSTAVKMAPFVKEGQIIVCVAKGIEENTLMTISDVVESEIPCADVAVMCGPSHAEEVGQLLPTTVVAGARTQKTAEIVQDLFMNEVFRVYTSPDVLGMELGGSLKNVIALVPERGKYKDLPPGVGTSRRFHEAWTRYHSKKPSKTIDTGHRNHFQYK